jgi:predicted transcriptional regulator
MGYSNKEISELTGVGTEIIHSIKSRRSWKQLSKDYIFFRTVDCVPYTLTDETLHNLCKDIMKGTMTGKDIAKKYNVSKSYIAMVKHYKIRPEITKMYEFNKRKNLPKRQNDELLNKLCKDLQDGVPVKDIMAKYEVGMSFVSEVKHGKIRPDISKNYKFK